MADETKINGQIIEPFRAIVVWDHFTHVLVLTLDIYGHIRDLAGADN